jgi:hypothetical protein
MTLSCTTHCACCGSHFTSLAAFDAHRVRPHDGDRRCSLDAPELRPATEDGRCELTAEDLYGVVVYEHGPQVDATRARVAGGRLRNGASATRPETVRA